MLKFLVLGSVAVRTPQRIVEIHGSSQRALLVTLLIAEGRAVSVESLITELWGERPPMRVENALQAHVSRLRRKLMSLEPECRTMCLETLPFGYRLRVEPDGLDAACFTRTVSDLRNRSDLDPPKVADGLRKALSLWQGPIFGGPLGGPNCEAAGIRYEEERISALEMLYEHELRRNRHAAVVVELSKLVVEEPLNERFCGQLMVALYRAGRQAEALTTYRRMWERLDDQLGVVPSPPLEQCQRAILAHDPALSSGLLVLRS